MVGETGVKRRWKKMVCRMPTVDWKEINDLLLLLDWLRLGCCRGWNGERMPCTFDDVLDVGPVGYYVEHVLWWTTGFHCEGVSVDCKGSYVGRKSRKQIRILCCHAMIVPSHVGKVNVVRHACVLGPGEGGGAR